MPFNLSTGEIFVLLIVAVLVFGGSLPDVARKVARGIGEFRRGMSEELRRIDSHLQDAPSDDQQPPPDWTPPPDGADCDGFGNIADQPPDGAQPRDDRDEAARREAEGESPTAETPVSPDPESPERRPAP